MPAKLSLRLWCLALLLLTVSTKQAWAVDNFAGTFRDERLILTLQSAAAGNYQGSIQMNGQSYPVQARANGNNIEGTFSDNAGNSFPFTAKLEGGSLTLTSGSTTYQLAPAGNAAPPAPQQQPQPKPTKAGIGVNITIAGNGAIMVNDVVANGPAARAGIKVGDQLVAIDGTQINGVEDLAQRMPGEVGSHVKVTVRRAGQTGDFDVTREMVNVAQAGNGQQPAAPQPGAPVVAAKRHEYQVVPNTNTIALMPELQNCPPPGWVKPGLRIITYQADASVPGGRQVLVQDPDGTLHNAAGQTFSLQDNASASGHGFSVTDVIAVLPDVVVAEVRMYLLMDVNNLISFSSSWGISTTPSCAADLWVHPSVLAKYLEINGQGVRSFRTPYKAAGNTYNALWRSITGEGGTTLVYDIDSGLRLHTALSSFQEAHTAVIDGKSQLVGGMTNLSQTTLAGIRQVNSPWTKGRLPRVLEGVRQLTYEGTSTTFIPGAPLMPSPVQSVIRITGRGDDFVQAERTGVMMIGNVRNDLGKVFLVSGPTQMMPFAIDPADLAKLKQGQVLDQDPTTKEVVRVSFIGRDKRGQNVVMITSEFPGVQGAQEHQKADCVYDMASGLMVQAAFNNPFLHIQNQVALKSKQ